MKIIAMAASAAVMTLGAANAAVVPVDLSTWTVDGPGSWNRAADNNSVTQTVNGSPTVFSNGVNSQGLTLSGTITAPSNTDDDFFGFVLGFNSGDLTNANADYILIDWKQADQDFFGCQGAVGLAASRVTGTLLNGDNPWCHTGNVEELERATNLGSTGWIDGETYSFDIVFTDDLIQFSVDGVLELSLSGTFSDGSFGFYNYSQAGVVYGALGQGIAPDPVPLPAALPLFAFGLAGMGIARRKLRKA